MLWRKDLMKIKLDMEVDLRKDWSPDHAAFLIFIH